MTASTTVLLTATLDTPDGPFTVIERRDGTVIAAGWDADPDRLAARARPAENVEFVAGAEAVGAVRAYYSGDLAAVAAVPVAHTGTPLQLAVWEHMRTIAPGKPETYSGVAAALGKPRAFRAVANTCARNAVGLFVPCHRVVPSSGKVTGFAWGPEVKEALLTREAHEQRRRPPASL